MDTVNIACFLSSKCNLNCDHCLFRDNHNKDINVNEIKNLACILIDKINSFDNICAVRIALGGGELFLDSYSDEIFECYVSFCREIQNNVKKDIHIEIGFSSNLIFQKVDRVLKLLKDTNSTLGVSYDPTGRFKSTRQENLFFKNIQIFADAGLLECIDICPTNNNIEYYINHTDILKKLDLYGCGINFSYYVSDCTKDRQRLIPDPDLLYKLFEIILINSYNNYNTVNMFTSSIYNYGETIKP